MNLNPPTSQEVEHILRRFDLPAAAEDIAACHRLVESFIGVLAALDLPADPPQVPRYPRGPVARPAPQDNLLGAWYMKTRVEGAPQGPLKGRTVALKDTVMLAGVPLMAGTRVLEGYLPREDATIVTRILDAGATITGKAVCEAYCLSGSSHTADTGPVHNPYRRGYSAGGSSSGSAALVAAGEVDMAIGCDQGGSIRLPAAACGIYGLKPTYGLVPYTGILGMEATVDHAGPMTRSVADNALLLDVIAGADGRDSRQASPRVEPYTEALAYGVAGLRIGVLREGFGQRHSEPDVDAKVRAAAARFATLGAEVLEVSIPEHKLGGALFSLKLQSMIDTMFHTDGGGIGRQDPLDREFLAFNRRWRQRAAELPETVTTFLVMAEHLRHTRGYDIYAQGVNLVPRIRAAYDAALQGVDLLLMPTAPIKAQPLPAPDASQETRVHAAFAPLGNTQPFNHTHHPALSLPCGMSDGLPVGLMLVGRHYEEAMLYRAAHAFEQHADWREL